MGRIFTVELDGRIYRCKYCQTHLAVAEDLISKQFHCRRGKAYLFNNVANVSVGGLEERMMLSGMHTVADIFCCFCGQNVGWKYVRSLYLNFKIYVSATNSFFVLWIGVRVKSAAALLLYKKNDEPELENKNKAVIAFVLCRRTS